MIRTSNCRGYLFRICMAGGIFSERRGQHGKHRHASRRGKRSRGWLTDVILDCQSRIFFPLDMATVGGFFTWPPSHPFALPTVRALPSVDKVNMQYSSLRILCLSTSDISSPVFEMKHVYPARTARGILLHLDAVDRLLENTQGNSHSGAVCHIARMSPIHVSAAFRIWTMLSYLLRFLRALLRQKQGKKKKKTNERTKTPLCVCLPKLECCVQVHDLCCTSNFTTS